MVFTSGERDYGNSRNVSGALSISYLQNIKIKVWIKERGQPDKQWSTKHRKLKFGQHEPNYKPLSELRRTQNRELKFGQHEPNYKPLSELRRTQNRELKFGQHEPNYKSLSVLRRTQNNIRWHMPRKCIQIHTLECFCLRTDI